MFFFGHHVVQCCCCRYKDDVSETKMFSNKQCLQNRTIFKKKSGRGKREKKKEKEKYKHNIKNN